MAITDNHEDHIARVHQNIYRDARTVTSTSNTFTPLGAENKDGTDDDLPKLLVIGAQKAGTTYLRHLLASHPDLRTVCDSDGDPGEAHFFDNNLRRPLREMLWR